MTVAGPLESETCRDQVLPALHAAGWSDDQIVEQYRITDGRIIPGRRRHRRERPLRADYVLEVEPGTPVAVVEAKRAYRLPADGLQQALRYAGLLEVLLAYATNGEGIVEHDYDTGRERDVDDYPTPEEAWRRFRSWRGIADDDLALKLLLPFNRDLRNPDGTIKTPRYYQRIAINRALESILRGDQRVLLTMATGTGKTFAALQIVWKLWSSTWRGSRKPRILYLADRNILVDQPIVREFQPVFGDAIWKIRGEARTGRDIYFALYQALADTGDALGVFRDYPADFFDLVIVDECHRGSAADESNWRAILEHFAPAAQLGMTATPLRSDNVDTYRYFGDPVFEYSLQQGIDDGFLAPYRVRRVVLSPDAHGWEPDSGQLDKFGREIPPGLYTTRDFERVVSLLDRTEAAARHLTDYLRRTDPMAKTIVFCVNSEHAAQMRQALVNANTDLVRRYPDYVVRIVSDEGDVGRQHLDTLADPDSATPVIATTSKLLSVGVDLPTVRNVVLFKPIGSIVDFKQIIGRGTRLYPDADKLTFEIIDYSDATELFADPDFDGTPERLVEEEIDERGAVVATPEVAEPEPTWEDTEAPEEEADAEVLEARAERKFYVENAEAYVVAEGYYLPDPQTGRHRLVEYADFAADTVRRLFADPAELLGRWRTQEGRDAVLDVLSRHEVDVAVLGERTRMEDADPLDVLVHIAWREPLTSRRERTRRVRTEHRDFLAEFRPEARAILEELLEKYAQHGPSELDLHVLEVPPFVEYGTVHEIAERFGGADGLREAIDRLQELLYAA